MRIALISVLVDDQETALSFYTQKLGFIKKNDIPAGAFRWLTVVSPEGPDDVELVLEPNANPAAKAYQAALFEQGIPLTAFAVKDIQAEYARLKAMGVVFRSEPVTVRTTTIALFEDTCGNLIQLYQE